ncbi:peptidylprolyl isomerase [Idiomarina tyrosinivorans]|uniref:Periplasmic chaperone PpiD n=1 Tax=Idiomarina tyrosinivorans TaxID=1445662 RepID=A0A432ZR98_9GAMM|nr:peptidylprolyl isomerase [Idiomarina tyrosinivorans]RUO80403.1 peptidylprolyl isomerase [Idiomarina tyrosinivorans]
MMEKIREGSQSVIVKAILVLIILTFALAGVGSYITGNSEVVVAKVNGEKILQQDFDRAYQNERDRLKQQFGDMYEAIISDSGYMNQMRQNVLENLIEKALLQQFADELGLRVSDQQVKQAIRSMPQFKTAGSFNNDMYLMALRNVGFTPESFASLVREQMLQQQVMQGVAATEFSLKPEQAAYYSLQNETRSGRYIVAQSALYTSQVEVTDEELQTYYDENSEQFYAPEQMKVAFVELSKADLMNQVNVSDDEVKAFYEANKAQYGSAEERRVSHILVEYGDDKDAARQKIEQAQQALQQGEDFAAVAKQYSTDTFSAEQGGDLGWIEPGVMDKDFDSAVFALNNSGDVSGIVETSFGYHIIKLTDVRESNIKPLEEVRDDIVQQLKEDKADELFFNKQQQLAEISFEQPDTLEPAAEAIGVEVKNTDWFTRDSAPTVLSDQAVMNKIFAPELIDEQLNSDVITTADDKALVVRVTDHQPKRVKDFATVSAQIRQTLVQQKAQDMALAQAQKWADVLASGDVPAAEVKPLESIMRTHQQAPRQVVQTLFTLAPQQTQAIKLNNGDAAVVQLTDWQKGQVEDSALDSIAPRLQNRKAQVTLAALIEQLKAEADISRSLKAVKQ